METRTFGKEAPVALVTGASSGFGRLTAELLQQEGFWVFGTSRSPKNGESAVEIIQLDVRNDESVRRCVDEVISRAGRIDVLVNNAGQIHASTIEETSLEQARAVFETNFWGVVRMTNAVLPHLRQRRSGLIINVGSLAGLIGVPGQGFYSASKFALEGYSETLSVELQAFGIRVAIVEPGFFKTNLHQSITTHTTHDIAAYRELRTALAASISSAIERGDDPRKVAEAIVRIATSGDDKLRHRVGDDARWVPRLKAALPERAFRKAILRRFAGARDSRDA
ncbi:MAG TPA: SDR family NAD(P)-dependent oxidoreductase [Thermoanaerobaculia bacterium]|nr:SDR family NAD(P)-dependent oxidoreductase [Thermoanaerobaculia bacterium]